MHWRIYRPLFQLEVTGGHTQHMAMCGCEPEGRVLLLSDRTVDGHP